MPLFELDGKKALFLHIPKTGGTSVESFLSENTRMSFYSLGSPASMKVSPQHFTIGDMRVLLGEDGWDLSFSVIRDPYDRIESEYFHRSERPFQRFGKRPDFSSWVVAELDKARRDGFYADNHWRLQTDFVDSEVELYRLEDGLSGLVSRVADFFELDAPPELPHQNKGERASIQWSLEALNAVNRYYETDFEQLGYKQRTKSLKLFGKK